MTLDRRARPKEGAHGAKGAYGIRLIGVDGADELLVAANEEWPTLRLVASVEDVEPQEERVTDDRAVLNLNTGGRLTIDREDGVAHYVVPRPLSNEELVHPFLAPAASVMAHWLHRQCFHAGAFVSDAGVWALAGEREAGKSSMLAWLALRGHEVFADDVVVIENTYVFAGPRSIDLRAETADRFGVGRALGIVGARPRWRLALPGVRGELPFRGWVFLSWGESMEAEPISGSERLVRLFGHRTLRLPPPDPAAHLALAALPAWDFRRPRDWRFIDEAGERLLELTSARAGL